MAYVLDDEKKKQNPDGSPVDPTQDAGGMAPGAESSVLGGGGGSPVSTAGVGAGGTGGWTNIQAYLNANKGDTGTANALKDTVGSTFAKEKEAATTAANAAKSSAQSQVEANKIGQDKASQLVQAAGAKYQYPAQAQQPAGPPSQGSGPMVSGGGFFSNPSADRYAGQGSYSPDAGGYSPQPVGGGQVGETNPYAEQSYDDIIGSFKNSLGAKYGGPSQFSYGMGADAKKYGESLGNAQGFQSTLNSLYDKQAGGRMGTGMKALQSQLDTNNDALEQAKQDLLSQYAGLSADESGLVHDTDSAVKGYANQFGQDQEDLRNYLTGGAKSRKDELASLADSEEAKRQQYIAEGADRFKMAEKGLVRAAPGVAADYDWNNLFDPNGVNGMKAPEYVGDTASIENVADFGNARGQYNAIMDALGLQDRIGKSNSMYSLGDLYYGGQAGPYSVRGQDWLKLLGVGA